MNVKINRATHLSSQPKSFHPDAIEETPSFSLQQQLLEEMHAKVGGLSRSVRSVVARITCEVERVCSKSARIQNSGKVRDHLIELGNHRLNKCLHYYKLGSQQGRVELHGNLSVMNLGDS